MTKVVMYGRSDCCAERVQNLEVRITDQLPATAQSMYTWGKLLGSFEGPATKGQIINVNGAPVSGRKVLIQMDNEQPFAFREVTVFGKGTRSKCQSRAPEGSRLYGGKAETTEKGMTCRNWMNSTQPSVGNHNYCRNPTGGKLWCYVSEENLKRDYCAVPFCGETGA